MKTSVPVSNGLPVQLGITGGIGAGKSLVCRILKEMGIEVFDADSVAKNLLNSNDEIISRVKTGFGNEVYNDQNVANRSLIASIIYDNPAKLDLLNSIIHPGVKKEYDRWLERNLNASMVAKEAAIMFESGSNNGLDFIITVTAPEALRIKRVMQRDNSSEEKIKKIIDKQSSDEEKIAKSDFIIINDDKTPVLKQILDILSAINIKTGKVF